MLTLFRDIFYKKLSLFILLSIFVFMNMGCFLVNDDPLKDKEGNDIGSFKFASGPSYGNYYSYADGIIDAASEKMGILMSNVATNGSLDNAVRLVTGDTYLGNAYMAMMQEDVYEYVRQQCITQYNADPDTVNKNYLTVASRTKVLLALYNETVHLLVNNSISNLTGLNGKTVNIGTADSGTFITAKNILEANGISCTLMTDDAADGVQKVVDGEYDAAFFVTATPSSLFQDITSTNVKLIKVTMPSGKKTYKEDSSLSAKDYPNLLENDISGNISVRTLLVGGPNFDDRNVSNFLDYIFKNAEAYKSYNRKWGDLSVPLSLDYMKANPEKCNFKALCYVSGFPELDPFYVEDNFFTDYGISSYHDMYVELDYLLTLNAGIGLKEVNTTGTWENAYRLMMGEGLMAIVQDDIFEYLKNNEDMYDSMMAASMKKLVPLHYEYVHLLSAGGASLASWLSGANDINVGPKTSGTFITAMNIINSYTVDPNISYYFDEADIAVQRVGTNYDAAFVVSGVPFNRFYSHDTWDVGDLNGTLEEALFYDSTPYPYTVGNLDGAASSTSVNYPYTTILSSDIPTVRVRAIQVVSPVFESNDIDIYLKSVFRKGYYMTIPPDTGSGFISDPLWVPIVKESMTAAETDAKGYEDGSDDGAIYAESEIVGAMEYFVNNPYGWHDAAADYYLSMFED
ncbi:MAG: hypothetical protein JW864_16495 [Spirochaetes bacterium]|nr:hypothetical protein [Spirochaetota bacterium]